MIIAFTLYAEAFFCFAKKSNINISQTVYRVKMVKCFIRPLFLFFIPDGHFLIFSLSEAEFI